MVICSVFRRPYYLSTDTTLVSPSSSGDGKSDDTVRHILVFHTLVIRRWQVRWHTETPHCYPHPRHPEMASSMTCVDTSWLPTPSSSGDDKSNDTQRHLMVIRTLVIRRRQVRWHAETTHGYLHPHYLETTSLMRYRDTVWLSAPLSSRDGKSDDTLRHPMVICTLIIRRQQVWWHAENNVVIYSLWQRPQCLLTETTLV